MERILSTSIAVGEAFKDEVNAKDTELISYVKELLQQVIWLYPFLRFIIPTLNQIPRTHLKIHCFPTEARTHLEGHNEIIEYIINQKGTGGAREMS